MCDSYIQTNLPFSHNSIWPELLLNIYVYKSPTFISIQTFLSAKKVFLNYSKYHRLFRQMLDKGAFTFNHAETPR